MGTPCVSSKWLIWSRRSSESRSLSGPRSIVGRREKRRYGKILVFELYYRNENVLFTFSFSFSFFISFSFSFYFSFSFRLNICLHLPFRFIVELHSLLFEVECEALTTSGRIDDGFCSAVQRLGLGWHGWGWFLTRMWATLDCETVGCCLVWGKALGGICFENVGGYGTWRWDCV